MKARVSLAMLGLGALLPACAINVDGTFDGVPFHPAGSAVVVLDSHDVFVRDGAFVPVERTRSDKRVHLWLSSASLQVDQEWRRLPSSQTLEIKKAVADSDLVVLQDIDFDALQDGDVLTAVSEDGKAAIGDFAMAVAQHDVGDVIEANGKAGLGAKVTVSIEASQLLREEPRGGQLDAVITVKRERSAAQENLDVATGEVAIGVSLRLADERLAEANLAILAPIARCAAASSAPASCLDVPPDQVIDETGAH